MCVCVWSEHACVVYMTYVYMYMCSVCVTCGVYKVYVYVKVCGVCVGCLFWVLCVVCCMYMSCVLDGGGRGGGSMLCAYCVCDIVL